MNQRFPVTTAALLALLAAGAAFAQSPILRTTTLSTSAMHVMADQKRMDGAFSHLVRGAHDLAMRIETSGLVPGDTYTVWWVVFNNPAACTHPMPGGMGRCSSADLSDAATDASVLWATGRVADPEGRAVFVGVLEEGTPPGVVLRGAGLTDAANAELHFVLRSHGPVIDGLLAEQLASGKGGCPPNLCEDVQFSIHKADAR